MPSRPDPERSTPKAVGLGVSLVVHIIIIALYPVYSRGPEVAGVPSWRPPLPSPSSRGLQVIRISPEQPSQPQEEPEAPDELADIELPRLTFDPLDLSEYDREGMGDIPLSAAERLRPSHVVPELWYPISNDVLALSLEASERIVLNARVAEWLDSLSAAEAEERALTDWTYTDDDGKRWGAADGMIYLGDFAVPVPFGFGVSPGRREEVRDRLWEWDEIQRQLIRVGLVESWKERQEAMQERLDRERAAKADTSGARH